jgi:hypothetical protein
MNDTGKAKPSTPKNSFRLPLCPPHLPNKLAIETGTGDVRPATDHNTQRTAWFQKMKNNDEPPQSKQATCKKPDTRVIMYLHGCINSGKIYSVFALQ